MDKLGAPRLAPTPVARNGSVALAYDVRGRGSPLALLQGVGVGRWGWEPVADRLGPPLSGHHHRQPGHRGPLTPRPGRTRPELWPPTSWRSWTTPELGGRVVGTSLGGMVTQELALAHPDRVDRLVLVASIPGGRRTAPMPLKTACLLT